MRHHGKCVIVEMSHGSPLTVRLAFFKGESLLK
jgi:hypothetical protein